jgi:hypothetical protein
MTNSLRIDCGREAALMMACKPKYLRFLLALIERVV